MKISTHLKNIKANAQADFIVIAQKRGDTVLGEYLRARSHIKMKCGICDHVWDVVASRYIGGRSREGSGCPACANANRKANANRTHLEMGKASLIKKIRGRGDKLIGEYMGVRKHVDIQCKRCEFVWPVEPQSYKRGSGCPSCYQEKRWSARYTDGITAQIIRLRSKNVPEELIDQLRDRFIDEEKAAVTAIYAECKARGVGYEVDHVIPLSWWDLTNIEQLYIGCSAVNLRVVTAKFNRDKRANLTEDCLHHICHSPHSEKLLLLLAMTDNGETVKQRLP